MKSTTSLTSALGLILIAAIRFSVAADTNEWVTVFDERFADNPNQRFKMVSVPIPGTTSSGATVGYDEDHHAYSVAGHLSLVRPVRVGPQVLLDLTLGFAPPETKAPAAEQGNDQAQFNYARNLFVLRGASAAEEIVKWLNQSAAQGNEDAQYRLGLVLYEAKLVLADRVNAAKWAFLAEAGGNSEARWLIKEMKVFLSTGELAEARRRADEFKPVKGSAIARKAQKPTEGQ